MQIRLYALITALIRWSVYLVDAEPMTSGAVRFQPTDQTSDPLDCSFAKLHNLIGHSNFSILGMRQNCAVFYILGENIIYNSKINISKIDGSSDQCQSLKPLFYKQNNEYRLLIAQKMSMYTGECFWKNTSNIYLSCLFERKYWKKHSIKPSVNDDDTEIIGHITDIDSTIIHIFYIDGNGIIHDSAYNISSEKFIKNSILQQKNLKKLSYDFDRGLMYMLTNEMVYQRVKSNNGIFNYEPTYAKVNNFNRGSYSALSFSNHYYIVKKMLGDGRIAYYAGKEGNQEQVCVTEILPDETLHLSLFVGTTSESTAYERIRNQLLPVIPDSQTTTPSMTASRLSSQTTSFILLALLLFIISK